MKEESRRKTCVGQKNNKEQFPSSKNENYH